MCFLFYGYDLNNLTLVHQYYQITPPLNKISGSHLKLLFEFNSKIVNFFIHNFKTVSEINILEVLSIGVGGLIFLSIVFVVSKILIKYFF